MSAAVQSFLTDTLLWTGVLVALVLLLRRPVARHLGPHAAYALWALPLLRLILPPVVLPAWLAPAPEVAPGVLEAGEASFMVVMAESPPVAATATQVAPAVDWLTLALAVWLAGAAVFLVTRFGYYFRMRRDLLEEARPVGEAGDVRLVETPATTSPIAFGVFDKVIALPMGFMALGNRTQRDLALEHEICAPSRARPAGQYADPAAVCAALVQPARVVRLARYAPRPGSGVRCAGHCRAHQRRSRRLRIGHRAFRRGSRRSPPFLAGRADGVPGDWRKIDNSSFEEPDNVRHFPPPPLCRPRADRRRAGGAAVDRFDQLCGFRSAPATGGSRSPGRAFDGSGPSGPSGPARGPGASGRP